MGHEDSTAQLSRNSGAICIIPPAVKLASTRGEVKNIQQETSDGRDFQRCDLARNPRTTCQEPRVTFPAVRDCRESTGCCKWRRGQTLGSGGRQQKSEKFSGNRSPVVPADLAETKQLTTVGVRPSVVGCV
jgi:hypothetical protein